MSKVTLLREVRLLLGAGSAKPGPAIGQVFKIQFVLFCHVYCNISSFITLHRL